MKPPAIIEYHTSLVFRSENELLNTVSAFRRGWSDWIGTPTVADVTNGIREAMYRALPQ